MLVCFRSAENANGIECWEDTLPELTRDEFSDCPRSSNPAGGGGGYVKMQKQPFLFAASQLLLLGDSLLWCDNMWN